ncbi:MAG: DNA polymerase III subunit beta [Phycisphaerae bacterium]|nr:DNA polymerase III subunit beta [Phycisphaerae bacterium]MDW8261649.1 DNA polymerase III subunit beta [Phycisphaerales bacterium]
MKVICNRGALLDALNVTGNVVAARSPKEALKCVKLAASDDRLVISATDLEIAIRYIDSQVQIEKGGETLVPADKLRDIVRESIDDTLSLDVIGEQAHIRGNDAHFKIYTRPADEFPAIPEFRGEADLQIGAGPLKKLIGQTLFAAARESTRYAFNGVLLVVKGKKLSLIATDGRRLALAREDASSVKKSEKELTQPIIPAKALNLLDKLLDDPEETVSLQLRENQIHFSTPNATLTTNLVEGQFPPYEEVLPKDSDKKMTASTADFLSAIRRAALLTTEESKGVRMAFNRKGVVLSSRSPESGEATVNFACKYEGSEIEIGFNPVFLIEALRVADSDEISLEMTAPNRPGLLKSGANFQYVIMPVNLQ